MRRRRKRKNKRIAVIIIAVLAFLYGMSGAADENDALSDFSSTFSDSISEYAFDSDSSGAAESDTDSDVSLENSSASSASSEEMTGDFYSVVGEAEFDTTSVDVGEVTYSELDSLGRAEIMISCITYEMMMEGLSTERDDISDIYPTGWTTNQQVTITYDDGESETTWALNRSHLLADSLSGVEEDVNLITGTRTQNVGESGSGGMAYGETLIRSWLYENENGYVYYSVDPVYDGDDLMAETCLVNILSSDGELDEQIIVYNTLPGYEIDYATGEYWAVE